MNIKRIALCALYVMIAMFIINTEYVNAEEEKVSNEVTEQTGVVTEAGVADITITGAGFTEDIANGAETNSNLVNDVVNNQTAGIVAADGLAGIASGTVSGTATAEAGLVENADADTTDKSSNKDNSSNKNKKNKKNKKDKIQKGSVGANKYTKAELRLLSALIYCEAGAEPYAGKLAVGVVVCNRREAKGFADTIKGVIYQKSQFSPARNGSLKRALASYDAGKFTSSAKKQCIKAAKAALSGEKKVTYAGKTKNMKGFYYFNGYVRGARYRIKGHMFK